MAKLSHFPSSPSKRSAGMALATFLGSLGLVLCVGAPISLIPFLGWVVGPILIVIGLVGMVGCFNSRKSSCPHCSSDMDLYFPYFLMQGQKCKVCKHQMKYEDGRIYDVSAIPSSSPIPIVEPAPVIKAAAPPHVASQAVPLVIQPPTTPQTAALTPPTIAPKAFSGPIQPPTPKATYKKGNWRIAVGVILVLWAFSVLGSYIERQSGQTQSTPAPTIKP